MLRTFLMLLVSVALVSSAAADETLASHTAMVNGTTIHYVRAGDGPPLVLLHGFPQDWSEYRAIIPRLAQKYTVVAVDLRGIGESEPAVGGYDAANMAEDVYQLLEALELQHVYVVGHDVGGIVAHALARRHPQALRGVMILDAPIPGMDGWDESMNGPVAWHVHFMQVPDLPEKLVTGRQADYFHYFYSFGKFTPEEEARFASAYRTPEQLHAAFEMYRAFPEAARFNQAHRERTDVPLFYGAGERSPFAKLVAKVAAALRASGFTRVDSGLIQGGVHYLVQDEPDRVAELIEQRAR
jgi:pimeloyl-ACP methyl ester carboxylesterase